MERSDPVSVVSPTSSATPVIPWQTPWSQPPQQQSRRAEQPMPGPVRQQPSRQGSFRSTSSSRQQENVSSLLAREREHLRGQRRLHQQQQHRQTSLELLEARSINRALEQQRRHDREEIEALREGNDALLNELDRVRALLKQARSEERRLSAALTKQASLVSNEEKKKDRSRPADSKDHRGFCRNTRNNSSLSSIASSSSDGITDCDLSSSRISIDSSTCSSSGRQESESPPAAHAPAPAPSPAHAPPVAAPALPEDDGAPHLPHVLEQQARQCLTGTVSGWVKGMQAACSESLRQALVLPWLLHKLFYLSTELIDDRREEVVNIFVAEGAEGAGAEESAYMLRHLRRHYLTIFPLSGDSLKTAVHKVMMALAHSMIDSEEWNPAARDPNAVHGALAASGLEKIVEEYLHIAVLCCLQHPVVTFTDDLGEIERYSPERHSEPIDGEPAGEWCIVIFPAFVASRAAGGGEAKGCGRAAEEHVFGKRFVLNHKAGSGKTA